MIAFPPAWSEGVKWLGWQPHMFDEIAASQNIKKKQGQGQRSCFFFDFRYKKTSNSGDVLALCFLW